MNSDLLGNKRKSEKLKNDKEEINLEEEQNNNISNQNDKILPRNKIKSTKNKKKKKILSRKKLSKSVKLQDSNLISSNYLQNSGKKYEISDDFEAIPIQENLQKLLNDKEKYENIMNIISQETEYTKIKFKSLTYSIGDKLLIFSQNEILIGELLRIIPQNGNKRYSFWPTIEVKWYYKKSDINRKKNNLIDTRNYNSISEFELFPSEHKDIIFIETLIGKCDIYSYEEYEKLEEHNDMTFFTRANYDPVTQLLNPRFDEWEKGCMCKRPLNPDQFYIKCDGCNNWFHPKCCGLSQEETKNLDTFICPKCIKIKEKEEKNKKLNDGC